jgi:hypothetical protein
MAKVAGCCPRPEGAGRTVEKYLSKRYSMIMKWCIKQKKR